MITKPEIGEGHLTHWNARLICECKKQQCRRVHDAVACEVSGDGAYFSSDHNFCERKQFTMHLSIPALMNGEREKIVRVIGRSLSTVMKEGRFLTAMKFLKFEGNGKEVLESDLHQRFNHPFFGRALP